MKKLLLTLTLAAFTAAPLTLNAADEKPKRPGGAGGPGGAGRVNPEERLKKMTEQLSLNQEQQDKIKAIMESGREEFGKLRDVPEDQRREKMREAFQKQNEKILAVLTPEQQEKYKTAMAERTKAGGPGGARGEGGKKPEGDKKPEEKK